jgi:hypothetical protein
MTTTTFSSLAQLRRDHPVQFRGFGVNPDCNTGLPLQPPLSPNLTVGIDYVTATTAQSSVELAFDAIQLGAEVFGQAEVLTLKPGESLTIGRRYDHHAVSANGLRAGWTDYLPDSGEVRCLVQVPGKLLGSLTQPAIQKACRELYEKFGFTPTRIDIALDDHTKMISPEQVEQALDQGNYSRFQKFRKVSDSDGGVCYYMGSRESDKMLRFYDKGIESKGEIDAYRWELELKDFKAKQFWLKYIYHDEETLPEFLMECVIGAVEFIDRREKNVTRCKPLEWWAEFLKALGSDGGIKFKAKRLFTPLENNLRWLERSVAPSLAVLAEIYGDSVVKVFIARLIKLGKKRLTPHKLNVIKQHLISLDSMAALEHTLSKTIPPSTARA